MPLSRFFFLVAEFKLSAISDTSIKAKAALGLARISVHLARPRGLSIPPSGPPPKYGRHSERAATGGVSDMLIHCRI